MLQKRSKYNAKKTVMGGITFDSALEGRLYNYIKTNYPYLKLDRQISYELLPKNDMYRAMVYKADFVINDDLVIDAKGLILPEFRLKQKLFYHIYHKPIIVVKSIKELDALLQSYLGIQKVDSQNPEKTISTNSDK